MICPFTLKIRDPLEGGTHLRPCQTDQSNITEARDLIELEQDVAGQLDVLLLDVFDGDDDALVETDVREDLAPARRHARSRPRLQRTPEAGNTLPVTQQPVSFCPIVLWHCRIGFALGCICIAPTAPGAVGAM